MDPEFADLIPLFVSEARGRLERLAMLLPQLGGDPQTATEIRRELHTLKGAGRMLRLTAVSELCHAAEGALQSPGPSLVPSLTHVVDALTEMVEAAERGDAPAVPVGLLDELARPAPAATGRVAPAPARKPAPEAFPMASEVRVDSAVVDALADRATRMRILAQGAEGFVARLHELAELAERGAREPEPGQILAVLASSLRHRAAELESGQRRLSRVAGAQLESIVALQLQPLRAVLLSLARHARELARELGREVDVEVHGEDTRLDRRITRELEQALIHLVRNAVDHGVEPPEVREAAGKPRAGRLRLGATAEGGGVRIEVVDDGGGIDAARVAATAVERGLVDASAARALPEDEVLRLLFLPGFSTRGEVSEVSGRGVGLDVVAEAVNRAGGNVSVWSRPGEGTRIILDVPAARRGEHLLIVRVGSFRLAIPKAPIRRMALLPADRVVLRSSRTMASLDGRLVPFVSLAALFGQPPADPQLLLVGEFSGRTIAVGVDDLEAEEEALIRPVGRHAALGPLVEGTALRVSGEPVVVLSPVALAQRDTAGGAAAPAPAAAVQRLRVLLVDDSLVTREMMRRLLEDAGFTVTTAADAGEALSHLAESAFECLVTDVEMPGMDGFALTSRLRTIPRLAQLPVIVVSTRERPEDRLAALDAGADAFLSKQRLDASELVALVRRLGGRR